MVIQLTALTNLGDHSHHIAAVRLAVFDGAGPTAAFALPHLQLFDLLLD